MKRLLFITIWYLVTVPAIADHHVGMDLTYRWTGVPDQYELTLTFYRDCDGMGMPFSAQVCFRSVSCNFLGSVTLNRISGPTLVPWPDCVVRPAGASGCNGGGVYDVQKAVFKGTLFLPYQCNDWQFEYVDCCRNYDITTISPAGTENFYLEARIDNLNYPQNSSPQFNSVPVNIWCLNKEQIFDPGVTETDGDSLVFELVTPRSLSNMVICDPANPPPANVNYVGGYTAQNFMSSLSGIQMDPKTGVIRFTPDLLQVSVVDLKVKEYRNGQLIGSVTRGIQFFITPLCQSSVPEFVTTTISGIPKAVAGICNENTLVLTLDKNILCNTIATDGSDFAFIDPSGNQVQLTGAAAHSCIPPYDNQVIVTLASPLVAGVSKIWSLNGSDLNTLVTICNDQLPVADTVNVVVAPCNNVTTQFSASDTAICERTCLSFTDQSLNNPINWNWSFPGGTPNSSSDQHPSGICYNTYGDYDVTLVACNGTDCDTLQITNYIHVQPSLQVPNVNSSGNTLICDPAPYYQWYLNNVPIPGATSQTYTPSQPGDYYVLIFDDYGCEVTSDLIVITGTPEAKDDAFLMVPNPFTDKLEIKTESNTITEVYIRTIEGRLVWHGSTAMQSQGYTIPTTRWPAGVYLLTVVTNDRIVVRKLLKNAAGH